MKWRRKPVNAKAEQDLLIGMITSDAFLKGVQSIFTPSLLQIPWAKIVANWCMGYFRQYEKAPGRMIEDIFTAEKSKLDETQEDLIAEFLTNLSEQHEKEGSFNAQYKLDQSELYLKTRSLEELASSIKAVSAAGNITEAEALVANYKRVARPVTRGVDVLSDKEAIINAFEYEDETLFQLPGDLGKMLGPFPTDDLIAVVGPGKRGKSFWIDLMCNRSMLSGLNTLLIDLEMNQSQRMRRLHQFYLGEAKHPGEYYVPMFDCILNQTNECTKFGRVCGVGAMDKQGHLLGPEDVPDSYIPCTVCRGTKEYQWTVWKKKVQKQGATWRRALRKSQNVIKLARGGRLWLANFPAGSVTLSDIRVFLDNLEHYDGFVPRVIGIDYLDYLAASGSYGEKRHKIDEVWSGTRGLAQERHCRIFTASHTTADTFDRRIKQKDLSELKAKANHVAKMFALNQTEMEKRQGVMQIGTLFDRHEDFDLIEQTVVLEARNVGKVYLDSYTVPKGMERRDKK